MAPLIPITDLDDPRVAPYRDVRDADLRGRDQYFMAESEMVVRRLVRTPQRVHSLLLSEHKAARMADALELLPDSVPVYVAPLRLISDLAGFLIHRGVLAAGIRLSPGALTLDRALGHLKEAAACTILIAEGFTNVDNMGALFRNAAAFGVDGVLLDPTCCDPLYRKAIRVSMGHSLSIPYAVSEDWPGDLDRLKQEWEMTIVGAEVTASSTPLWTMPRQPRSALLFGSESHGVTPPALACCDEVCAIPMHDGVPSLNVAMSTAVFLYELGRKVES